MSGDAKLSGDSMVFSGSINTAFCRSASGQVSTSFSTNRDANIKWNVTLNIRNIEDPRNRLRPQVRRDPDTMAPQELFRNHGDYSIAAAYLGGRTEYNATVESSRETRSQDVSVAVQATCWAVRVEGDFEGAEA